MRLSTASLILAYVAAFAVNAAPMGKSGLVLRSTSALAARSPIQLSAREPKKSKKSKVSKRNNNDLSNLVQLNENGDELIDINGEIIDISQLNSEFDNSRLGSFSEEQQLELLELEEKEATGQISSGNYESQVAEIEIISERSQDDLVDINGEIIDISQLDAEFGNDNLDSFSEEQQLQILELEEEEATGLISSEDYESQVAEIEIVQ